MAGLDLMLAQRTTSAAEHSGATLESLVGRASRYRPHGAAAAQRIAPGHADASIIVLRMKSTNPVARMPPIGVEVIDDEGIALLQRWIQHYLSNP